MPIPHRLESAQDFERLDSKVYRFLDGTEYPRDGYSTRGEFLEKNEDRLPPHIAPVVSNDCWAVRQDAEFPVPGFYIVSSRPQVESYGDLSDARYAEYSVLIFAVRREMKALFGIERVQTYTEEKVKEPHLHTWLLPLWPEVLERAKINPRIWEGNIREYLNLFSFEEEGEKILQMNERMREALSSNTTLRALGFSHKTEEQT